MKKIILTASIGDTGASINYDNTYSHPLSFHISYPSHHVNAELNKKGKELARFIADSTKNPEEQKNEGAYSD